jgi:hypothetical protein
MRDYGKERDTTELSNLTAPRAPDLDAPGVEEHP